MERDLEYVYAVYQMGSFSKAAKFLFASQPTVSMAVQRVEEDLGYPVFDRQSHPLQLTAAGERFIQHVERVRESEKALRTEIDKIYRQEEEILRIGTAVTGKILTDLSTHRNDTPCQKRHKYKPERPPRPPVMPVRRTIHKERKREKQHEMHNLVRRNPEKRRGYRRHAVEMPETQISHRQKIKSEQHPYRKCSVPYHRLCISLSFL